MKINRQDIHLEPVTGVSSPNRLPLNYTMKPFFLRTVFNPSRPIIGAGSGAGPGSGPAPRLYFFGDDFEASCAAVEASWAAFELS